MDPSTLLINGCYPFIMAIVSSNIGKSDSRGSKGQLRVVTAKALPEEEQKSNHDGLRPKSLNDFVGHSEPKEILRIAFKASNERGEALDHVLLYGPPGLGKTTLALVLANELGVKCHITSAPALERPRDIVGLLVNLRPRELLFIDEIHRLSRVAEELLYSAMEDFRLDLTVGKGTTARMRSLDLPSFTLIGATTRPGSLSSPLRDRFGIMQRLDFYNLKDLQSIVSRSAGLLGLLLTDQASLEIARRCRGTPRIANRLIKRVRDFAIVKSVSSPIEADVVENALRLQRVDKRGLDETDRRLLDFLVDMYQGGPVGLDTLAAALGEDSVTIEAVIEPFLLQIGFLQRTPRGRMITPAGRLHLESNN